MRPRALKLTAPDLLALGIIDGIVDDKACRMRRSPVPSCPRHLMPSIRLGSSTTRPSQTSATKSTAQSVDTARCDKGTARMSYWERHSMLQVSNTSFTTSVSSNAMAVVDYLSKSMMSRCRLLSARRCSAPSLSLWAKACWACGLPIPISIACSTVGSITPATTFCPFILVGRPPPARLLGAAGHDAGRRIDCTRFTQACRCRIETGHR